MIQESKQPSLIAYKRILNVGLSLLLLLVFTACTPRVFDGSRTKNDKQFLLDYEYLNQKETHTMELESETTVRVEIESLSGKVHVIVKDASNNEIYRGNNANTISFILTIPTTDNYSFVVMGEKAKGSVYFKVVD